MQTMMTKRGQGGLCCVVDGEGERGVYVFTPWRRIEARRGDLAGDQDRRRF